MFTFRVAEEEMDLLHLSIAEIIASGVMEHFDDIPNFQQEKLVKDLKRVCKNISKSEKEELFRNMPKHLRKKIGLRVIQRRSEHIIADLSLLGKKVQILALEDAIKGLCGTVAMLTKKIKKFRKQKRGFEDSLVKQSEAIGFLKKEALQQKDVLEAKDRVIISHNNKIAQQEILIAALSRAAGGAVEQLQTMKNLNKDVILKEIDKLIDTLGDVKLLKVDDFTQEKEG